MAESVPNGATVSNQDRVCGRHNHRRCLNQTRAKELEQGLRQFLKGSRAPVASANIKEFANAISECEERSRRLRKFLELAHRLPKTDILFWLAKAQHSMEFDETLWRAFLAGHFGRTSTDSPETVPSAAKILCGFGGEPHWTWKRVSSELISLRPWLMENRKNLKSLRFGNHRKYESHKPLILHAVIASFCSWVVDNGGTPSRAFGTSMDGNHEASFDRLYSSLRHVFRLGRTGVFDLLCLLGNTGILTVRPGSCYLRGSTGPLRGARKLWGQRAPAELSELADATAKGVEIPSGIFEDALCMWQK